MTASGSLERDFIYSACAWATRRTLPKVKSSAITPLQPSVPNLIWVGCGIRRLKVAGLVGAPEGVHDLAHVLRTTARDDQERVLAVDDDNVLHVDRGDQAPLAEDDAPSGVDQHRFPFHRVAAR